MSNVRLRRYSVRNLSALHFFYGLERNPVENTQKKKFIFCYWATSPDWGISSFHSEVAHISVSPFCAKIGRKNQDMQYSLSAAYNPAPFTGTCSHNLKEFLLRYLGGPLNSAGSSSLPFQGSVDFVLNVLHMLQPLQFPKHIVTPSKQKCLPFLQINRYILLKRRDKKA